MLRDGGTGVGAKAAAARPIQGDRSVGEAAAAKAQRQWRAGQLRQRRKRGGACLGDGGGGPREMAATERQDFREVGRKENREQEATCAGPVAYSTGPCKNP